MRNDWVLPFPGIIVAMIVLVVLCGIQIAVRDSTRHLDTVYEGTCRPRKLVSGNTGITLEVDCRGQRGFMRDTGKTHLRIILAFTKGQRIPIRCEVAADTTADCEPLARKPVVR